MVKIKLNKKGYVYRHCNLLEDKDSEVTMYSYEEVMTTKDLTERQKQLLELDRRCVIFYGLVETTDESRPYHTVGVYDIYEEQVKELSEDLTTEKITKQSNLELTITIDTDGVKKEIIDALERNKIRYDLENVRLVNSYKKHYVDIYVGDDWITDADISDYIKIN